MAKKKFGADVADDRQEQAADAFAAEWLIPRADDIKALAEQVGVTPGMGWSIKEVFGRKVHFQSDNLPFYVL